MRLSHVSIVAALVAFAGGMWLAYAFAKNDKHTFVGTYHCPDFGLPDRSFSGLKIDKDLNVYGTGSNRKVPVGKLDPRAEDLAYFDINKETLTTADSPLDPMAQYIVDNAGDAILILVMENNTAKMSHVCHRNL